MADHGLTRLIESSRVVVPRLRVRGLKKTFGSQTVLDGVDLDIGPEEHVLLFGASGSGKTVLMKCILGLITPDAGSVQVDGIETVRLPSGERERLMHRIGVLFQNGALFDSLTVWENIVFGRNGAFATKATALNALPAVGLDREAADLLPSEMSGGMQKRAALARAIAGAPDILLLDNPTEGLDPILTTVVETLIIASQKRLKAAVLTITHDLASAKRMANKAAFLHGGRIAWCGPIAALESALDDRIRAFVRAASAAEQSPAEPHGLDRPAQPAVDQAIDRNQRARGSNRGGC
jgi:phospholipid/cholesterol/gamma-HCH transport system ATP-binding protein